MAVRFPDDDVHGEDGPVLLINGVEAKFRNVHYHGRPIELVRQPPHALHGQLKLCDAPVQRRIQLP